MPLLILYVHLNCFKAFISTILPLPLSFSVSVSCHLRLAAANCHLADEWTTPEQRRRLHIRWHHQQQIGGAQLVTHPPACGLHVPGEQFPQEICGHQYND